MFSQIVSLRKMIITMFATNMILYALNVCQIIITIHAGGVSECVPQLSAFKHFITSSACVLDNNHNSCRRFCLNVFCNFSSAFKHFITSSAWIVAPSLVREYKFIDIIIYLSRNHKRIVKMIINIKISLRQFSKSMT